MKVASTRPTGSGKAATSSTPRAIASIRAGSSVSRSINAGAQVLRAGVRAIEFVGGQNFRLRSRKIRAAATKRAVLPLRRRVGDLTRGGARLRSDFAHRGANIGFRLDNLNNRHKAPTKPRTL